MRALTGERVASPVSSAEPAQTTFAFLSACDFGLGVADLGEDGVGVLAGLRRCGAHLPRRARHVDRLADELDVAELGVRAPWPPCPGA